MRLIDRFITLVIFSCSLCTATTIATTHADPGGGAFANPYNVYVFFDGEYNGENGAYADYQTDCILTMLNGTGPGYASFVYGYSSIWDIENNGYLEATINGEQAFYRESTGWHIVGNGYRGFTIPIVYGVPTPVHLGFTASVGPGAIRPHTSFHLVASLSLSEVAGTLQGPCSLDPTVLDCGPRTQGFTLVEAPVHAPEPSYGLLAGIVLLGIWVQTRRT